MRPLNLTDELACEPNRQEVLRGWFDRGSISATICHAFPPDYRRDIGQIWGFLLSDIFHHVVNAFVEQFGGEITDARKTLADELRKQMRNADRPESIGDIRQHSQPVAELPLPDLSRNDRCTEFVRIILVPDSIDILLRVGIWPKEKELGIWGNVLVDLADIIATSLRDTKDPNTLRADLLDDVLAYIDEPSTTYKGRYFDH